MASQTHTHTNTLMAMSILIGMDVLHILHHYSSIPKCLTQSWFCWFFNRIAFIHNWLAHEPSIDNDHRHNLIYIKIQTQYTRMNELHLYIMLIIWIYWTILDGTSSETNDPLRRGKICFRFLLLLYIHFVYFSSFFGRVPKVQCPCCIVHCEQ